jgi:hypothetical protein
LALCKQQGKRSLKVGTIYEFGAASLFLTHKVVQPVEG